MRWWRSDNTSTLIEFDEHGRVIRIPGVYPWPEKVSRWRPIIFIAIATIMFVAIGVMASY